MPLPRHAMSCLDCGSTGLAYIGLECFQSCRTCGGVGSLESLEPIEAHMSWDAEPVTDLAAPFEEAA